MRNARNTENSDQKLLRRIVVENSVADDWESAKTEWELMSIYDKVNECICTHRIVENCVIRNRNNAKELIVGNVCVNQFKEAKLSVPKLCRTSLKKLQLRRRNPETHNIPKANRALIEVAVRLKILSENEGKFYNKAPTNSKKMEFRRKINYLIMLGFRDKRPECHCGELAKPRQNSGTKEFFYSCYDGRYVNRIWRSRCNFSLDVDLEDINCTIEVRK